MAGQEPRYFPYAWQLDMRRRMLKLVVSLLVGAAVAFLGPAKVYAHQEGCCQLSGSCRNGTTNPDQEICEVDGGTWNPGLTCEGDSCLDPEANLGCCKVLGSCVLLVNPRQCMELGGSHDSTDPLCKRCEASAETGCCVLTTGGCIGGITHTECSRFGNFRSDFLAGNDRCDTDLCTPTAIDLRAFTAAAHADGTVTLMWETATEIGNVFNLYRASTTGGPYTQINHALIPAQGDPVAGARYTFTDAPGPGAVRYILTDVDASGKITLHGPVKVKVTEE
jgi:hypothetical protein